jgi:hypothetical protein
MPEGIQVRGPYQFRVQVRRNGVYQTKTFERLSEAQEWQRVMEGKVTGEELVDLKRARSTTLARACDWMLDGKHTGNNPDAKNVAAKLRYWKDTKFAIMRECGSVSLLRRPCGRAPNVHTARSSYNQNDQAIPEPC